MSIEKEKLKSSEKCLIIPIEILYFRFFISFYSIKRDFNLFYPYLLIHL